MALDYNITLSQDTLVTVWISPQHAASVAAKNPKIVHSLSDYFYLACPTSTVVQASGRVVILWDWLIPPEHSVSNTIHMEKKQLNKSYTFDPLAGLTFDEAHLVLGGQQLLWTEQSDAQNLESIAWPRTDD
ncbi:hypothetical protein C8R44DRAFT_749420 [Mycena epipterygia]|nr:hypothetical protein C8R44DRAFT_749420 [Mycena epipterygia]